MYKYLPPLFAGSLLLLIACDSNLNSSAQTQTSVSKESTSSDVAASVNSERLIAADENADQWMSYGRTYDEQRFSPLTQINTDTVSALGLQWFADIDTSRHQEATPIVVDGKLFVSTAWSKVKAFDALTGKTLWQFDPKVDRAKGVDACCDVVNRGVAVWEGKVFVGTIDGRLIALDANNGDIVWEKSTVDQTKPYTITGAPRVIKGKVLIGNGGAEYGVRGYVSAYDANDGNLAWRFYTVPGNPADGFEQDELKTAAETWKGEWWKLGGGGTVWDAMAYDADLDLLYIGVGNGSPWNQSLRSPGGGDNLFLSSIVALDPDDGSYKWHYQTTPGETWDYTATQHIIVADLVINDNKRRVVMQAPKNGFFYVLDAATGEFISADNYVPVNWATHIDPQTGWPVEVKAARYDLVEKSWVLQPGPQGGHNWHPMSFSQQTGLVYIPASEQAMGYTSENNFYAANTGWNTGVDFAQVATLVMAKGKDAPQRKSYLLAWDPVAQKEVWRVEHLDPGSASGILTTAGNLVFQGNYSGEFSAYKADSGEKLWSHFTQAGIVAAPATYAINGEQYVALLVGTRNLPQNNGSGMAKTTDKSTNNSRLLVYKLGGNSQLPQVEMFDKTTQVRASAPPMIGDKAMIGHGSNLYGRYCSVCHGQFAISGEQSYPDLRFSPLLASADGWSSIVIDGALGSRGMASFKQDLDKEQVEAIRAFVIMRANQ